MVPVSVNFGGHPLRFRPRLIPPIQHWVDFSATTSKPTGTIWEGTGYKWISNVNLEVEPSGTIVMQAERSVLGHNFPSATVGGCILTTGRWYYEFTIVENSQAIQIGWADLDFVGSNRDGMGVGDDKHSWGFDGCRAPAQGLWWNGSHTYGRKCAIFCAVVL